MRKIKQKKSEKYLTDMYASVDRMNEFYLQGNLKEVELEKRAQRKIKKYFFGRKAV